jgi:hypothetical protein
MQTITRAQRHTLAALALALAVLPLSAQAAILTVPKTSASSSQTSSPNTEVCFYLSEDFKGRHFCEVGTRAVSAVPAPWRTKIKSITVSDQASVRVCPANELEGDCTLISRDTRKLETGLFNHVFSYDIRQVY